MRSSFVCNLSVTCWEVHVGSRVWTCRAPFPQLTLKNEVSLLTPGTGSIQDVHLGQVVFTFSFMLCYAALRPSCSPAPTGKIHPHCLRTNEPIHLQLPIDKLVGKYSTNTSEGSGEWASGPAILFRTHIMSHTIPSPGPAPLAFIHR